MAIPHRMLAVTIASIFIFLFADVPTTVGQDRQDSQQPFVGFQSFDGRRVPIGQASNQTRSSSVSPNSSYGYPGSSNRSGAPIQTRLTSQMTRSEAATGGLNNRGNSTAALVPSGRVVQSALPQQRSFQETSTRTNNAPRVASSPQTGQAGWTRSQGSPTLARPPQAATNNTVRSRQTARINQAVVQQTSSTMPSRLGTGDTDRTTVARPSTPNTTRVARAPQNCVCAPAGQTVPYRAYQAAANQTPTLTVPNGAAPNYQFQPGLGVPQLGSGNVLTPFVRGSGVYTPLLPLQSMPQGAYLGQGIIGQPTAYVDGQPFRNLLRYISP